MHHVSIGESEEGKVSPAAGGEGRGGWKRGVEESRGGRGGLRGRRGAEDGQFHELRWGEINRCSLGLYTIVLSPGFH